MPTRCRQNIDYKQKENEIADVSDNDLNMSRHIQKPGYDLISNKSDSKHFKQLLIPVNLSWLNYKLGQSRGIVFLWCLKEHIVPVCVRVNLEMRVHNTKLDSKPKCLPMDDKLERTSHILKNFQFEVRSFDWVLRKRRRIHVTVSFQLKNPDVYM